MSTLLPEDTQMPTPDAFEPAGTLPLGPVTTPEQLELDLCSPAPEHVTGETSGETPAHPEPSASNPVPIGLQELMALGAKVEALGKAMQDPNASMDHLVALSAACGLAMHIEIVDRDEQPTEQ